MDWCFVLFIAKICSEWEVSLATVAWPDDARSLVALWRMDGVVKFDLLFFHII